MELPQGSRNNSEIAACGFRADRLGTLVSKGISVSFFTFFHQPEVFMKKKVGIVMGSDSDLPIMRKAADTLAAFGVPFEVHVMSAHRTPDAAAAFVGGTEILEQGIGVLIDLAGGLTVHNAHGDEHQTEDQCVHKIECC